MLHLLISGSFKVTAIKALDNSAPPSHLPTPYCSSCECSPEGSTGELCELRAEIFCPGQCSGRGECLSGFCKCEPGWYGTDCSRNAAGRPTEPSTLFQQRPWLENAVRNPEADRGKGPRGTEGGRGGNVGGVGGAGTTRSRRRRPFIYVYDLPPDYNARMLQYKIDSTA